MTHAIAIVSGGMDSVTLAYALRQRMGFDRVDLVSVNYGQRHVRELDCAALAAHAVGGDHIVVDLPVTRWLIGSALTDPDVPVPEGHYADESMRATVVPNRNAMLLSIAVAVAVARKADAVATGVHAGDHPIYPDCRPEFIDAFHRMSLLANEGFTVPGFRVFAPFVHMTKTAICALGDELGVPFADTWSCYQGGEYHCGACGTCVERREAFELAHVPDPTIYSAALPKSVR